MQSNGSLSPRSNDETSKAISTKPTSRQPSPLVDGRVDSSFNSSLSLRQDNSVAVKTSTKQTEDKNTNHGTAASFSSTVPLPSFSNHAIRELPKHKWLNQEDPNIRVSNRHRSISTFQQSKEVKEVLDQFKNDRDELMKFRKNLKHKKFMRLFALGLVLMISGAIVSVVMLSLAYLATGVGPDTKSITNNFLVLSGVLGGLVAAFGFLIVTCALSDDFDLDEYHRDSTLSMAGPLAISAVGLLFSLLPPFFSILILPIFFSFWKSDYELLKKPSKVSLSSIYRYDLPSYKFLLVVIITFISLNLYFCWSVLENAYPSLTNVYFITRIPLQELFPRGVATSVPLMNIVLFNTVSFGTSFRRFWYKHQMYLLNPIESTFFSSTMLVIYTSHCIFLNLGFSFILLGLMQVYLDEFYGDSDAYSFITGTVSGYTWMVLGFEISIASFLAIVYSPKALFNFMMRFIIGELKEFKEIKEKAGLYISNTLKKVQIVKGDLWYIHCYPKSALPERELFNSKDKVIEDSRRFWYKGKVREITETKCIVDLDPTPETVKYGISVVEITLGDIGNSTELKDLNEFAKANLRYVDWEDIKKTKETIFKRSVREEDGSKVDLFETMSKKVAPHQVIDYFISHSWDDDGAWKFQILSEVSDRFYKRNGRYPTFWFDKVCINQNDLKNGLKVLPFNLMACRKMLVLVGKTYPRKIWCAWELYVRLLFTASANEAIESMEIYTEDKNTVRKLLQFDVTRAYAYDPNEQLKLRLVIESFKDEFNDRIFELAKLMITKAAIEGKIDTSVGVPVVSSH